MATKRDINAAVAEKTLAEKERILKIMRDADIYTRTLDPLIENYLDVYEIYQTMFLEWKGKGFPAKQFPGKNQEEPPPMLRYTVTEHFAVDVFPHLPGEPVPDRSAAAPGSGLSSADIPDY